MKSATPHAGLILMLCLVCVACTPKLPDEVKQGAITVVETVFAEHDAVVDQVKVVNRGPSILTAADLANGLSDGWCVNLSFIQRPSSNPNDQWQDAHRVVVVLRGKDGLSGDMLMNHSGRAWEAQQAFMRCTLVTRNQLPLAPKPTSASLR